MKVNVNTTEYWNRRFNTNHWSDNGGHLQTHQFTEAQLNYFDIPYGFTGSICDFGCGAGDSFPLYRNAFKKAKLLGVDFSEGAINKCVEKYKSIAEFKCGDISAISTVDVIICSNVLEHIADEKSILKGLLEKCMTLYIIVPYKERNLISEHLRSYDENSYDEFNPVRKEVYVSKGWSEMGKSLYIDVYFKNIFRFIIRRPLRYRNKQILFEFKNNNNRIV